MDAVKALAKDTGADQHSSSARRGSGRALYNGGMLDAAKCRRSDFKVDLPNSGVFDESACSVRTLCRPSMFAACDRCSHCKTSGARPVAVERNRKRAAAVANGSPFARENATTGQVAVSTIIEEGLPLVYLNQVGGQDELVFAAGSFVLKPTGGWPFSAELGRGPRAHPLDARHGQWVARRAGRGRRGDDAALYAGMGLG